MKNKTEGGLITKILLIIIALALLKFFFDFNIIDFFKSPKVTETFAFIKKLILLVWHKILVAPLSYVWEEIVIDVVWKTLKEGFAILNGWVGNN